MESLGKQLKTNIRSASQRKTFLCWVGLCLIVMTDVALRSVLGHGLMTQNDMDLLIFAFLGLIVFFALLEMRISKLKSSLNEKGFFVNFSQTKNICKGRKTASIMKLPRKEEFILCFEEKEYDNDAEILATLLS